MSSPKEKILSDLKKALKKLSLPVGDIHIEHPALLEHGDYAANIALKLAKTKAGKVWQSPMEIAEKIAEEVQKLTKDYAKVTVAKPGFINFTLTQEILLNSLTQTNKVGDDFGKSDWGKGKTVVIDYSAPNIAKPFGIGHLRSTIIGQSLYNIYQFLGWRCIGDNHIGDWGTQFGKLVYMIQRENFDLKKLSIADLEKLYVQFHKEAGEKPELEDEGRRWFKKLEKGDRDAREIWKACVNLSLKEFERIYNLLGVKIDYVLGESFYEDKTDEVVQEAREKGIVKKSEGALVIDIPGIEPPLMLLKSDGATTYETRDLATIKYRIKTWNPDLYIYEVGAEQKLHFQKIFGAAALLGYGKPGQFVHVAHGLFRTKTGKFSTRKGLIVHLEDVLKEAVERTKKVAQKAGISKDLSDKEREKVARAVGIGAIKYNDLKQSPERDIVFDWDKILVLEGNSGPYLQYTHARTRSVLAKAKQPSIISHKSLIINPEELSLLRTLYKFPEVVEEAGKNYAPNLICNFLFDLAQKFNLFYTKHPILKPAKNTSEVALSSSKGLLRGEGISEVEKTRNFRLALTSATAQVLKNGLLLLGIEPMERM